MEEVFQRSFHIRATEVDGFDRLKLSRVLDLMQETAGDHSALAGTDRESLAKLGLFWAVIRHRVQITRLPGAYETVKVETWPMPTTRTAYPRATCAYDAQGRELFRSVSLWVLMDIQSRSLILPGKSGVVIAGTLRGGELSVPGALAIKGLGSHCLRQVRFTDLDWNLHMNNCRYMDWVEDTLPALFHREHCPREFVVHYAQEAREGDQMELSWELDADQALTVEARGDKGRVFSAKVQYDVL